MPQQFSTCLLFLCLSTTNPLCVDSPLSREDGGRSSVIRATEFKSEDPGVDPLAGRSEGQLGFFSLSESTLVQTCLCLTLPPFFVCTAQTQICHKIVGLTAIGMEPRKHCTQWRKKKAG